MWLWKKAMTWVIPGYESRLSLWQIPRYHSPVTLKMQMSGKDRNYKHDLSTTRCGRKDRKRSPVRTHHGYPDNHTAWKQTPSSEHTHRRMTVPPLPIQFHYQRLSGSEQSFQVSQIISDNLYIHSKAKDTLLSKALAENMHQEVLQSFSSDLRARPE